MSNCASVFALVWGAVASLGSHGISAWWLQFPLFALGLALVLLGAFGVGKWMERMEGGAK